MKTPRIAVIGGGIAGLTAAGTLAKQGHAVTLFEQTQTLGGKAQVVTSGGFTFDTGPTLLTMPAVVQQTFEKLGAPELMPRIHGLSLHAQYRYADGRDFFCWQDVERTAQSAESLMAGEGAAFHRFVRDAENVYAAAGAPFLEAPYENMAGFLSRVLALGPSRILTGLKLSTLDALAKRHFRSEALQQFVGRFATYAGASPWQANAAFAMIAHIERAFGVHHVEGGMGALVRALATAATRQGVAVQLGARVTWQQQSDGRFSVMREGAASTAEVFDSLVVNADPLASLGRGDEPLAMSGYVMLLEASERVSLPHHTILFSDAYQNEFAEIFAGQIPSRPTVYVCHPAATDATVAPKNRSGLFVMINAPAFTAADSLEAVQTRWQTALPALRESLVARLKKEFSELQRVSFTQVGERTPVDLARVGAPGGSIYGFLPHGRFGPFRRPLMRTKTPGLYFAGGGTHPGGGVPLVMLSGQFAAGMAQTFVEQRS